MKVNSPWLIGGSGSAAGMTVQVSRGQTVLRQKPVNVFNPKTPGQLTQRARIKAWGQVASGFGPCLRPGMIKRGTGQTPYSEFSRLNMMNCTTVISPEEVEISFNSIVIAYGNTRTVEWNGPTFDMGTGLARFYWNNGPGTGGDPNDQVSIVVYDTRLNKIVFFGTSWTREALGGFATLPIPQLKSDYKPYIYVSAADGEPSNSRYYPF